MRALPKVDRKQVKKVVTLIGAVCSIALLGGCAAGKVLMSGYTPPQTIADLIAEQQGQLNNIPPELAGDGQSNGPIDSQNYLDSDSEHLDVSTGRANGFDMSTFRQVEAFRPRFSYKSVEDYAAQLSMALVQNRVGLTANSRVGISSFVKLDRTLQNTTVLGNQLAEYLISEMQQQGMPVVDHKLMPVLQVSDRGDIAFSRNALELSQNKVMDHVLSGTLIEKPNGVYVNARIISLNSNRVVSSANILIPRFVVQSIQTGYAG